MASISRTGPTLRTATIPRGTCPRHRPQNRAFSSTPRRSAARRMDLSKLAPKQQSISAKVRQMKRSDMPSDIGLIPGLFIRPTWKEGPSLLSSKWRQRLFMDWFHVKQSFTDFARWQATDLDTGKKIKFPLGLRERPQLARELHAQLYLAIANGDKAKIKEIACSGLAQQQIARVDRRSLSDKPSEVWRCQYQGVPVRKRVYWLLQFLIPNKSIKVVADRQVNLPFGTSASIRQVVLRIKSRQTLDRRDGSAPVAKNMTEYMVIQRMIIENDVLEWKVWGTTKPSTYQDAVDLSNPTSGKPGEVETTSWWDNVKMTLWDKVGRRI